LDASELSVDLSRELGQLSRSGSEAEEDDDDDAELRDYTRTNHNNNNSSSILLSSPSAAVSRTASNRATPNSQQHSQQQHLSFYAAPGSHSPLPLGWGAAYNAAGAPAYSSLLAWDEEAIQLPAAAVAATATTNMHMHPSVHLDAKQQQQQQQLVYSDLQQQPLQLRPLPAASKKPLMLHQQAWPLNSQQLDLLLSEAEQYDLRA
jgi:hypothetical protein